MPEPPRILDAATVRFPFVMVVFSAFTSVHGLVGWLPLPIPESQVLLYS